MSPTFVRTGSAFLSGGSTPGTGGLFVYVPEVYHYRMIAQILLEYAEFGINVLVIDRQDDESRSVLSSLAKMLNLAGPDSVANTRLPIPLSVRRLNEDVTSALRVAQVAFNSIYCEPDEHACDMGDADEVLYLMTYPNENARAVDGSKFTDLGLKADGRYARTR